MNIVLSVPSGFHARELLTPLKPLLASDSDVSSVHIITPAAPFTKQIFPDYGDKFFFHPYPGNQSVTNRLLSKISPHLVITNTSGLDSQDVPIIKAAHLGNIPTLTFVASWDNVWKMKRFLKSGKTLLLADYFIVWNTMMRDHLISLFPQLSQEQIKVIGAPRLDYFTHQDRIPSRQQLLRHLGLPIDDGKLIHFATTELYPMDYVIKAVYSAQRKGIIKHKLHLYASIHPGGDLKKYQHYTDKYNVTIRYSFGRRDNTPLPTFQYNPTIQDIYMLVSLFKHSDLLINHSSTVALESFLGDTPVINVKYGKPLDWWRWYRSMVFRDFKQHYRDIIQNGATKVVYNPRQLITAVGDYLDNPQLDNLARRATLMKLITTIDGTAGQQVLDNIKTIANHKASL